MIVTRRLAGHFGSLVDAKSSFFSGFKHSFFDGFSNSLGRVGSSVGRASGSCALMVSIPNISGGSVAVSCGSNVLAISTGHSSFDSRDSDRNGVITDRHDCNQFTHRCGFRGISHSNVGTGYRGNILAVILPGARRRVSRADRVRVS